MDPASRLPGNSPPTRVMLTEASRANRLPRKARVPRHVTTWWRSPKRKAADVDGCQLDVAPDYVPTSRCGPWKESSRALRSLFTDGDVDAKLRPVSFAGRPRRSSDPVDGARAPTAMLLAPNSVSLTRYPATEIGPDVPAYSRRTAANVGLTWKTSAASIAKRQDRGLGEELAQQRQVHVAWEQ